MNATKRKISERAKSEGMPEAGRRVSPLATAFPFCDLPKLRGVHLSGRAKRRHLYKTSTRHGAVVNLYLNNK